MAEAPIILKNAPVEPVGIKSATARVESAVNEARAAQPAWSALPVKSRVRFLRRFRQLIAENGEELARASGGSRERPVAETLVTEVLPLADACRFLERNAERLLAPRLLRRGGRPLWLGGVEGEIRNEPLGVVLDIGPANYPLFIPGVVAIQALVAGNAVLIKPGENGSAAASTFRALLHKAGLDPRLCAVLPEAQEAARHAMRTGVDKVFLTGSAGTGERCLSLLASHLTPAAMELSGCDAVFVRADADLRLVEEALLFGLRLNGGATCIAPRRVFVHASRATELEGRLARALSAEPRIVLPREQVSRVVPALVEALQQGAHLLSPITSGTPVSIPEQPATLAGPIVLAGAAAGMRLLQEDLFAPVLALVTVRDDEEALRESAKCPFALGAAIFTADVPTAQALAGRVPAGVVLINDLIAPTADPRVPFGGRKRSGFGVTRGAEGLLAMTAPKVVQTRAGSWRPHYQPPAPGDEKIFENYLRAVHGTGLAARLRALRNLVGLLTAKARKRSGFKKL